MAENEELRYDGKTKYVAGGCGKGTAVIDSLMLVVFYFEIRFLFAQSLAQNQFKKYRFSVKYSFLDI